MKILLSCVVTTGIAALALVAPANAEPTPVTLTGLTVEGCGDECSPDWLVAGTDSPTLRLPAIAQSAVYAFTLTDVAAGTTVAETQVRATANEAPRWTVPAGVLTSGTLYFVSVDAGAITADGGSAGSSLVVDTPEPPVGPTDLGLSPCLDACDALVSTSLTPVLTANLADPDSSVLSTEAEIRDTDGTVVATIADGAALAGGQARYRVPSNTLRGDGQYEFRANATDEEGNTVASAWRQFTVEPSPIAAPTALTFSDCAQPCDGYSTTSLAPTLSVDIAGWAANDAALFEVSGADEIIASGVGTTSSAVSNWQVPADALSAGNYSARAGHRVGDEVSWTAWEPLFVDVPPNQLVGTEARNTVTRNTVSRHARKQSRSARRAVAEAPKNVERYAPVLRFDSEEEYGPLSATTFLNRSTLDWSHTCGGNHRLSDRANWTAMGTGGYSHEEVLGPIEVGCSEVHVGSPWRSNQQDIRPYNEGGPNNRDGMYLNLRDNYRDGQAGSDPIFSGDEPVYYRYVPRQYIGYYFAYGDSAVANPGEERISHEGDWEFYWVHLSPETNRAVRFEYGYHGESCTLSPSVAPVTRGNHAEIYVGNHSHANYAAGYEVRIDDDASGDGDTWRARRTLANIHDQDWYGYTGAWGQPGNFGLTSGPEGIDAFKGAPAYSGETCEAKSDAQRVGS